MANFTLTNFNVKEKKYIWKFMRKKLRNLIEIIANIGQQA